MKKLIACLLVLVLALSVVACTAAPVAPEEGAADSATVSQDAGTTAEASAETEGQSEKQTLRVAHLAPNNDVSQTQLEGFIRAKIDEVNADPNGKYIIEYDHFSAEGDIQTQISQVENVIVKAYDYMIIFGVDSQGIAPLVEQAHNAGIKIVDICNLERPDIIDFAYLPYNEYVYAEQRDEFLLKYCEDHPDMLPMKTLVLYGLMSQLPQLPRGDSMLELAKENPDKFEILDTNSANWMTDKAQAVAEDWIQAYPDVDYICVANDTMAIGVIQALKAADMLDQVLVTSVDITPEGIQMIADGELELSVGADQGDAGIEIIDNIIKYESGQLELPEDKVIYIAKVWSVSQDTMGAYQEFVESTGRTWDVK